MDSLSAHRLQVVWRSEHRTRRRAPSAERRSTMQNLVSQSGWREAPRLRDMTGEIQFDQSTCQVEGEIVPAVEINLAPQEWVYFEHHCMLWKAGQRPAHGDDAPGPQAVVFPHAAHRDDRERPGPDRLQSGRDGGDRRPPSPSGNGDGQCASTRFLLASGRVSYTYERIGKASANILHGGSGMWLDRFITRDAALGLLVLHGYGNVFGSARWRPESIQVEDPAPCFTKDATVTLQAEAIKLTSGTSSAALRCTSRG